MNFLQQSVFISSLAVLVLPSTGAFASDDSTPVGRIVKLLKTIKGSSEADGEAEQQIYDKYACWCEKTSKRKADDIVTAEADLRVLGQRILKLKGKVATRAAEVTELTADINSRVEQQEQLTSVRQKQNAAWFADSAEVKQSLAALQDAIAVLSEATTGKNAQKHGGKSIDPEKYDTAMIQEEDQESQQMRSKYAVGAVLEKLPSMIGLAPAHMALLSEFTTATEGYAPQSATIQGMLGDMYFTFSSTLESRTLDEANQNHDYEDLTASLEKENNQLKATRSRKQTEKAEAEAMLADTTNAYEETDTQLAADKDFFNVTMFACLSKHKEWTARSKLRNDEIEGINAALDILTSDENRELFSRAYGKSAEKRDYDDIMEEKEGAAGKATAAADFFQVSSSPSLLQNSAFAPAARAYNAVKAQAKKSHSVRLAAIAVKIRTAKAGHFDVVIGAIDKMLATLEKEGSDDIAKKNRCNEEYQKIAQTVNDLDWDIKKNNAKIAKLDRLIELRTGEKAEAIAKIEETKAYITDLEKERVEENDSYNQSRKDDLLAIEVLNNASATFEAYITKNDIGTGPLEGLRLLQREPVFDVSPDDAPDAMFSSKAKNKGASKNVLSMFHMIVENFNVELRNAQKAEETSQKEYEEERDTAEKLVKDLEKKVTTLEGIIAERIGDKESENKDMKENNLDRDAELKYQGEIKPDCDWILKSFDQRADARAAEANGLTSAKEFLAGQTSLLEKSRDKKFEDDKFASRGFLGITQ